MKVICNKRTEECISEHGCYHAVPHEPTIVAFDMEYDALCNSGEGGCPLMYEYVQCIEWDREENSND